MELASSMQEHALDSVRLAWGDGSYAESLPALSTDPAFGSVLWGARIPSLARARRILDELAEPEAAGCGYFVILAGQETVVGVCRVDPLRRTEGVAEVGYLVAPAYRGRGYASAALRQAVDLAYLGAPTRALRAVCEPANAASRKVLEKIGFRLVQRARSRAAHRARSERVRYELTRDEWWGGLSGRKRSPKGKL